MTSKKDTPDLAAVENLESRRSGPPSDLSKDEARIWRRVQSAMPPDWFRAEHADLLKEYARHAAHADSLNAAAREIDLTAAAKDSIDGPDLKRVDKLFQMAERESRLVLALARSLRITHQAQVDPKTAGPQEEAEMHPRYRLEQNRRFGATTMADISPETALRRIFESDDPELAFRKSLRTQRGALRCALVLAARRRMGPSKRTDYRRRHPGRAGVPRRALRRIQGSLPMTAKYQSYFLRCLLSASSIILTASVKSAPYASSLLLPSSNSMGLSFSLIVSR